MQDTKIEWATHTFNPWMGCTKVSPACKNCYAERDTDKRFGTVQWGPNGTRVLTSDANWNKPFKWDKQAADDAFSHESEKALYDEGELAPYERPRVFCASLADVFENWNGPIVNSKGESLRISEDGRITTCVDWTRDLTLCDVRNRLFRMIDATPDLDWLLLTKRPENVRRMWPSVFGDAASTNFSDDSLPGHPRQYRRNVWIGTSVEDQEQANQRIPELLKCRGLSSVLFLSCEPLLGQVDLRPALWLEDQYFGFRGVSPSRGIDWVIAGGESGPDARPSHPDWFRWLRDQCQAAGVPFLFKQWGEWGAGISRDRPSHCIYQDGRTVLFTREDIIAEEERSGKLHASRNSALITKFGKKAAGRLLDGCEWNEFPTAFGRY